MQALLPVGQSSRMVLPCWVTAGRLLGAAQPRASPGVLSKVLSRGGRCAPWLWKGRVNNWFGQRSGKSSSPLFTGQGLLLGKKKKKVTTKRCIKPLALQHWSSAGSSEGVLLSGCRMLQQERSCRASPVSAHGTVSGTVVLFSVGLFLLTS